MIAVYDIGGRRAAMFEAGESSLSNVTRLFDAKKSLGRGIYLWRISQGSVKKTMKRAVMQ